MTINVSSDSSATVLDKAILLYKNNVHSYRSDSRITYATVHDICNVGSEVRPDLQIMPGIPATKEAIVAMMKPLTNAITLNAEFLPENVLSFSPAHLIWWSPECKRRIFFDNGEFGKKTAVVPHPALVHVIIGSSWSIFALDTNKRPTKQTALFHAPYFNIYDSGQLCAGSAKTPSTLSTESIPAWEEAFFSSSFTHVNGRVKKCSHPKGEYALAKELLDLKHKSYPLQYLVKNGKTINSVLKELTKSMRSA